jgi:hypothetical protein
MGARMRYAGRRTALAAITMLGTQACAPAWDSGRMLFEPGVRERAAPTLETMEFPSRYLESRTQELARRSPTWRAGMDSLRATGFWVVVGTPAEIRETVPGLGGYGARHLGEVVPVRDASGRLVGAVVTVDVELLRRLSAEAGLTAAEMDGDVDRILIHELYGHVLPLAWTRQILGGCPDPAPGEPAESSCAIQRENLIRSELGLEPRLAYDLSGLNLGRAKRSGGARGAGR